MRGFHEKQEAENLLALLKRSQGMLERFNAGDARIYRSAGLSLRSSAELKADARLCWYLNLALEMEAYHLSGRFSLYFSDSKRARQHPYNLMARLPITDDETEMAEIRMELLTGLDEEEAAIVQRKYARMLRIQPMRILFERLSKLSAPLRKKNLPSGEKLREKLLSVIGEDGWRKPVPAQAEYGRQSLDVADNGFTIIDRLIELHAVPLTECPQVRIPRSLLERTRSAEVHITAAIAAGAMPEQMQGTDGDMTDFAALSGGHLALGLYGEGAPDAFFRSVQQDQKRFDRHRRIVHTRRYCKYQLIRFSQKDVRLLRTAPAVESGVSAEPALTPPESQKDWYSAALAIHALTAADVPAPDPKEDALYLPDNGGNAAFRSLKAYLNPRKAETPACESGAPKPEGDQDGSPKPDAPQQKSGKAQAANELLKRFLKNIPMTEAEQQLAISELTGMMQRHFADRQSVEIHNGETVNHVSYVAKNWGRNVTMKVMAYFCRGGGVAMNAREGELPEALAELMQRFRTCPEERAAFRVSCNVHDNAEGPLLYVRYDRQGDACRLLMNRCARCEDDQLDGWFAANGLQDAGFSAESFAAYCLIGMTRHSFRRTNVGKKTALFELKPSKRSTELDKAFHLVLAYFLETQGLEGCWLRMDAVCPARSVLVTDGGDRLVTEICGSFCALENAERMRMVEQLQSKCLTVEVGAAEQPDRVTLWQKKK